MIYAVKTEKSHGRGPIAFIFIHKKQFLLTIDNEYNYEKQAKINPIPSKRRLTVKRNVIFKNSYMTSEFSSNKKSINLMIR